MNLMIKNNKALFGYLCFICAALLISGCAKQNTIYYWGDYQTVLYHYAQQDKDTQQQQIAELERIIEQAKAANKPTPPGLHAQLGLLYGNAGNIDRAISELTVEEQLFPESATFIEFAKNRYKGKTI